MDYKNMMNEFFKVPSYRRMMLTAMTTITAVLAIEVGIFTYAVYKFNKAGNELEQTLESFQENMDRKLDETFAEPKQNFMQSIDNYVK